MNLADSRRDPAWRWPCPAFNVTKLTLYMNRIFVRMCFSMISNVYYMTYMTPSACIFTTVYRPIPLISCSLIFFPGCNNENEPSAADPLIKETEEDEETGRQ